MVHIDVSSSSTAPVDEVWTMVADASGWSRWGRWDESGLERPGAPEADGTGAVRRFRMGRIVTREEVVDFDAPHHLGYTLLSGLPLRDYRGDVSLEPDGSGGTTIRWRSTFRPTVPGTGWLLARRLRPFLQETADALGTAAAARRQVPGAR